MDSRLSHGWKFHHWAAADGDVTVKAGKCVLQRIIVNKPASTAGSLTLRNGTDNTGAVVGIVDIATETNATGAGDAFEVHSIEYGIELSAGIRLDTDGTLAGTDLTIVFY